MDSPFHFSSMLFALQALPFIVEPLASANPDFYLNPSLFKVQFERDECQPPFS